MKRIVLLFSLFLVLAGCSRSGSLEPFVGSWKDNLTGMIFTLDSSGRYTMTDDEGTEIGNVRHNRENLFIFRVENGMYKGSENHFKLTVEGNEMSWEIRDGTVLKFSRIS
jgi:hypothetical protein